MWECPECGEEIEDQFDSCWKCAEGKLSPEDARLLADSDSPIMRAESARRRKAFWIGACCGAAATLGLSMKQFPFIAQLVGGLVAGVIARGGVRGIFAGFTAVWVGTFLDCLFGGFAQGLFRRALQELDLGTGAALFGATLDSFLASLFFGFIFGMPSGMLGGLLGKKVRRPFEAGSGNWAQKEADPQ